MTTFSYSPADSEDISTDDTAEEELMSDECELFSKGKDLEKHPMIHSVTQTSHGNIIKLPRLHIPGESGELVELSADLGSPETPNDGGIVSVGSEKFKRLYAQIETKKLKYKLLFSVVVITLFIIVYASVLFPWMLPYIHTVLFPLLYIIRIVTYTSRKWQAFCLDFCYSVNIALLIFCWAVPRSEAFFAAVFGAAVGPVAVAAVLFRNSIVFHDYDRMTSSYIHVMPNLLVYVIRWYPEKTSLYWYFHPNNTLLDIPMCTNGTQLAANGLPQNFGPMWLWVVAIPTSAFILYTVFAIIIEKICFDREEYYTMYRCLTKSTDSGMYRLLTLNGRLTTEVNVKVSWLLFNSLYCILSILGARICYQFQIVHTIYIILLSSKIIYNGASFYIDVFAIKGLGVINS